MAFTYGLKNLSKTKFPKTCFTRPEYSSSRCNTKPDFTAFYICAVYVFFNQCHMGIFQGWDIYAGMDHVGLHVWYGERR